MKVRAFPLLLALSALFLAACGTYMPQRYSISADNNVALRSIGAANINVGPFKGDESFDPACRGGSRGVSWWISTGMAVSIDLPDGMSFEAYIQKALADELKVAGIFNEKSPKVTLTGVVEHLDFSTTSSSYWDIVLRVNSSIGTSTLVREHYEFPYAFAGTTACQNAADAFPRTVQDLIGKLVKSPDFKALVTP